MNPRGVADSEKAEQHGVISFSVRAAAARQNGTGSAKRPASRPGRGRMGATARKAVGATSRDLVAWLCLGLGILSGAGALYYAISAIAMRS